MTATGAEAAAGAPARSRFFEGLVAACAVTVVLQGLWAGIFAEHDGQRSAADSWVQVHADGATGAIVLALVATVVSFVRLRARRDLWVGSAALTGLLTLESALGGGAVVDQHAVGLTVVHVPLALALTAWVVWLLLRARHNPGPAHT